MAHKSYRIRTKINEGDNLLKVNLKQGIDTINILSLELNTSDTYQLDTSNYGVIVGRVLANNAFGVPNVKVSVFIPMDEADEDDYVIGNTYPFKTLQSKDVNGVRYNVLPKNPNKAQSIGTFPNKRLVLDNDGELEVFDKYWKYTTTTNESGDYMLFGIPVGICQLHYDCDLSDIGLISQKPYDFINKGYDANLFNSPTEFKDDDLNSAVHILSQDKTIYVYPFWGDKDANNIGITRNDINLNYTFEPSCVFLGSSITDSPGTYIGIYGNPNGNNGRFASLTTSIGDIEIIRKRGDGTVEALKDNVKGIINGNGVWCYQIPMNLDRIGTNEEGKCVRIYDPNKGIPTRARVRMRLSLTNTMDESTGENTGKILIPNNPKISKETINSPKLDTTETNQNEWNNYYEFGTKTPDCCFRDMYWGKIYSVKQYYPRIQFGTKDIKNTTEKWSNYAGYPIQHSTPFSCISSIDMINGFNAFPYTTMYSGAENKNDTNTHNWFLSHLTSEASNDNFTSKGLHFCFENDWINGCIYLPKVILQNRADGTLRYFGYLNDENKHKISNETSYNNIYYSGRHQWNESGGQFLLRQTYVDKWELKGSNEIDNDNTSYYSQVVLPFGLITCVKSSFGDNIFYYRCGAMDDNNVDKMFYRLYATDLTLLGNISDVFDNLPNLAEKLPSTSALFPPIAPPKSLHESGMNMNAYVDQLKLMYNDKEGKNTDDVDMFGNWVQQAEFKPGKCKDQYWGPLDKGCYKYPTNTNEALHYYLDCEVSVPKNNNGAYYKYQICRYLQERCTLFFGCRVYNTQDFLHYLAPTFVNTSRISELAVGNDHAYNTCRGVIAINGIIDRFDIIDNEIRSLYASYNHNITRNIVNELGLKQYIPTQLYMVDFEGRLKSFVRYREYSTNTYDESYDKSYVLYRFGTLGRPTRYPMVGLNENNCDLLLMDNSFYMYFGLRAGFSAIDEFRKKYYNSDIEDPIVTTSPISIEASSSSCDGGVYGSSVTITPSKSVLTPPYTIYVYKGYSIVAKAVTNSKHIINSMESGFYSVEVIDSLNKSYKKDFVIETIQVAIDYTINVMSHGVEFNNIDGKTVTKIEAVYNKPKQFKITANKTTWIIESSQEAQIFSASTSTLTFNEEIKQVTFKLYINGSSSSNRCLLNNFSVFLPSKSDSVDTINGVPLDVIAPSETNNQWVSEQTMNPAANAWKLHTSSLSINEQREYLSKMAACVYGRVDMSLNVADKINYQPITICPNNPTYLRIAETTVGTTTLMEDDNYAQIFNVNGIVNGNINLPHLVGQNFPTSRHQKSLFKIKQGELSYKDNPIIGYNKGSKVVNTNANYFGIKSLADKSYDKPKELEYRDIKDLTYANFNPESYYKIQTLDKRFDYEICIVTPVILPSGYEKFTNLSNYSVIQGKLDADIYGGLRLDYDENDKITCYSEETGNLEGKPTQNGKLYQTQIFEDINGQYIASNLTINSNTQKINQSCNDYINVKANNGLLGKESLNFNLMDCSTDITDNIVKSGVQMRLTISYESDIHIIHTSVDDDNYDVVYKEKSDSPGNYLASLEGSSLKFTIGGDNLFNGSTYTDVKRNGLRANSDKDEDKYPEWCEKFANTYTRVSELCMLRMSGSTASPAEAYKLKRTFRENDLTELRDDSDASFFTCSKVDGEIVVVNDNTLLTLSEFTLADVSSGNTFEEHDYLIIPTRKAYIGNTSTLLNQASVINSGYAYYASLIHVVKISPGVITVQLFSPLLNNIGDGRVNYEAESLVGDGVHAVGSISAYYTPNGNVTYDDSRLMFTITITTQADEIPFYFIIDNGLKYKVIINNEKQEESND